MSGKLNVSIISPDKEIFSGAADSVQVPGSDGSFEVLAGHAPIISTLANGNINLKVDGKAKVYQVEGGVAEVLNNQVIILIERLLEAEPTN